MHKNNFIIEFVPAPPSEFPKLFRLIEELYNEAYNEAYRAEVQRLIKERTEHFGGDR